MDALVAIQWAALREPCRFLGDELKCSVPQPDHNGIQETRTHPRPDGAHSLGNQRRRMLCVRAPSRGNVLLDSCQVDRRDVWQFLHTGSNIARQGQVENCHGSRARQHVHGYGVNTSAAAGDDDVSVVDLGAQVFNGYQAMGLGE